MNDRRLLRGNPMQEQNSAYELVLLRGNPMQEQNSAYELVRPAPTHTYIPPSRRNSVRGS